MALTVSFPIQYRGLEMDANTGHDMVSAEDVLARVHRNCWWVDWNCSHDLEA
jgi:hypothetical protein